jgi:outer membrane protein
VSKLFSVLLLICVVPIALGAANRVLTLSEARQLALTNHPSIAIADYRVSIAKESTAEARSAFFPSITANATAVSAVDRDNTRIAAGGLNNPSVFERNSEGLVVNQIITDFGRTANLVSSAKLRMRGETENAVASRAQIVLAVDAAYFSALEAASVVNVATQTVATRQLLLNQTSALASNKLKSDLDVSFARVTLEEGNLLLTRARNDLSGALTRVATLIGEPTADFDIVDEPLAPSPLSTNMLDLTQFALQHRPELLKLRYDRDAALKFSKAERALHYPVISAIGVAGVIPVRDEEHLLSDNYVAGGVNLSLPIFAGGLHVARQREAALRAKVAEEALREQEENVVRDVRIASLNLQSSAERMRITAELLKNAARALTLAESRYGVGGASIIELSQAQLNKTAAEIANINARYEYQLLQRQLAFEIGAPLEPVPSK